MNKSTGLSEGICIFSIFFLYFTAHVINPYSLEVKKKKKKRATAQHGSSSHARFYGLLKYPT